ncbi:MAG: peroxide stress protein YaaA [Pseudorhodobacter sp.]
MLTVISPAKRLDETAALPDGFDATIPAFRDKANALVTVARGLTSADLRKLMGISPKLADLNHSRFAGFDEARLHPAALIFAGDTYAGLEARTLDEDALRYAQDYLRILSGLYGLLRPLDEIAPYRMEMGSRMENAAGRDLYSFWRPHIAPALSAQAERIGARALLNCASVEYFGAVAQDALDLPVITPVFLEERNGEAKVVSFWAKKARGAMARFVMEHRLNDPTDLRGFDTGGYAWDAQSSSPERPVFRRAA